MKTSDAGRDRIAKHEGIRLVAYPDPGTGGDPWTIGVGRAHGVKRGDRITHAQAMQHLSEDLATAERGVEAAVRVPLTQNQFDALVSLAFNIGVSALQGSTLVRLLNMGDYAGAAGQFVRWNRAGGRVMQGLTNRRMDERDLFLAP